MSVEKGVVISGFQKDYELLSWNEQGEITQVEGILTIAFLVVSSCSHIDYWKQLYLVIKIPYTVNMSLKSIEDINDSEIYSSLWEENASIKKQYVEKLKLENYDLKSEKNKLIKHIEIEREEINKIEQKIKKLESGNQELREKIEELNKELIDTNSTLFEFGQQTNALFDDIREEEKEFEKIKKENLRLKIVSGEAKSGWRQDRNMIERDNPITDKLEYYDCPVNFKHELVSKKKYLDENRLKLEFFHDGNLSYNHGYFTMATDAYLWLCGKLPEQKEKSKINIHDIKDDTDAKNYIKSIGRSTKGKYMYGVVVKI